MSYFVTVSGAGLDGIDFSPIRLVPAAEAQSYIQNLAPRIEAIDGGPVFLAEDGETATSMGFVCAAEEAFHRTESLDGTVLRRLLEKCAALNGVARIWWANDGPEDFLVAENCLSVTEALGRIAAMIDQGTEIRVRCDPRALSS